MPRFKTRVMRSIAGFASRLAPQAAGRLAFRLFCTPLPRGRFAGSTSKSILKAIAVRDRGVKSFVNHGAGYVAVWRFEPAAAPRGTILLVHGWTSESIAMMGLVEPLLRLGFRVVAFDLPAHGQSSGRTVHIPMAVEALAAVARPFGRLSGIIAHSFGGAVAVPALAGTVPQIAPVPADRIVLIGSLDAMERVTAGFCRRIGLAGAAEAVLNAIVHRIAATPMSRFTNRTLLRDLGLPTLILHAPDDPDVPFSEAEAMAGAGPHVTLSPAPGLGHHRILFAPSTLRQVTGFYFPSDHDSLDDIDAAA